MPIRHIDNNKRTLQISMLKRCNLYLPNMHVNLTTNLLLMKEGQALSILKEKTIHFDDREIALQAVRDLGK